MKHSVLFTIALFFSLLLVACGGEEATPVPPTPSGDATHGKELYDATCIACHGPGGEGVENLGKPFTTSEFIRSTTDSNLLAFIKEGRPTGDPENTTGVDMPPKGGNPALTDDDIKDIIAYIRTIQ